MLFWTPQQWQEKRALCLSRVNSIATSLGSRFHISTSWEPSLRTGQLRYEFTVRVANYEKVPSNTVKKKSQKEQVRSVIPLTQ